MGPLVDTSVLIDYFAGVSRHETAVLDELLRAGVAPATAPVIVQEFLQGFAVASDRSLAAEQIAPFDHLEPATYELHIAAAEAHLRGRAKGHTVSTVDALIVAMARSAKRPLLTRDREQTFLARLLGVQLA